MKEWRHFDKRVISFIYVHEQNTASIVPTLSLSLTLYLSLSLSLYIFVCVCVCVSIVIKTRELFYQTS